MCKLYTARWFLWSWPEHPEPRPSCVSRSHSQALDLGSVLCQEDGRVLGAVVDVFGQISRPHYLVLPSESCKKDHLRVVQTCPTAKRHALSLHCTICTLFSTHWTPHDTDSRSLSMFCRNCQKWVQPCWLQQACRTYGIAKPLVKGVMKMADRVRHVRRIQSCKIGMPQHESSFCFSFGFADFSLICEGDKLPVWQLRSGCLAKATWEWWKRWGEPLA